MIRYDCGVCFWTDAGNFEKAKSMLVADFCLVPPTYGGDGRRESMLAWKDASGLGRYRVHFSKGQKRMRFDIAGSGKVRYVKRDDEWSGPHISFQYWSQRMNDEVNETDPMKEPVDRTYELLKPVKVTDMWCREISLDGM